jgi:hypothetical protein
MAVPAVGCASKKIKGIKEAMLDLIRRGSMSGLCNGYLGPAPFALR